MHVVELDPPSIKDIASALLPTAPRSSGVHVSDIIKVKLLQIDPKRYGAVFEEEQRDALFHAGYLWEEIIGGVLARGREEGQRVALYKGFEIVDDGIYMTPDWFETDDTSGDFWVSETKASWKSSREWGQDPTAAFWDSRFVGWKMQAQAYVRATGAKGARFHVLWMNDDYTKYLPRVRSYQAIFTMQEQDENWSMLRNTARKQGWL